MTFWYEHAWFVLGSRVRHTYHMHCQMFLGLLINLEFAFVGYVSTSEIRQGLQDGFRHCSISSRLV